MTGNYMQTCSIDLRINDIHCLFSHQKSITKSFVSLENTFNVFFFFFFWEGDYCSIWSTLFKEVTSIAFSWLYKPSHHSPVLYDNTSIITISICYRNSIGNHYLIFKNAFRVWLTCSIGMHKSLFNTINICVFLTIIDRRANRMIWDWWQRRYKKKIVDKFNWKESQSRIFISLTIAWEW
jgi:hypothetical protein